jgi:hypothetical protein
MKGLIEVTATKGYVDIHIDLNTKSISASSEPYYSVEEAKNGVFIGINIFHLGTFEIEYPK